MGLPPQAQCGPVIVLDARSRLSSVPAAYAANAPFVTQPGLFAAGASLPEAAAAIHRGLEPYLDIPSLLLVERVKLARELVRHRAWHVPYDAAAAWAWPPTLTYINDFSSLPVYDVDFGGGAAPVHVFPHDLPDPVLIWPARDGVEVYFRAPYARPLRALPPQHPWFSELSKDSLGNS